VLDEFGPAEEGVMAGVLRIGAGLGVGIIVDDVAAQVGRGRCDQAEQERNELEFVREKRAEDERQNAGGEKGQAECPRNISGPQSGGGTVALRKPRFIPLPSWRRPP
jgi:hypothetical protein